MEADRIGRRSMLGVSLASGVAFAGIPGARAQAPEASSPSSSSSKLQEVLSRGKLIVGTGADVPPFYFKDEKGELAGLEIDLARLLARNLFSDPARVEFIIQNSDARIPNLIGNRVDVTLQNLTVTAARAQQVEFTVTYYRAGQGLLMSSSSRYKDYAALRDAGSAVTVSTLQNVTAADWVHEALPEAKVDQYPSPDAALQALNARRADAHMITHGRVRWAVTQFPSRYRDSGFTWRPNSIAAAIKSGDPLWLNWLNTALREALTGVDFEATAEIYKRWLGEDIPSPKLGYPRELVG